MVGQAELSQCEASSSLEWLEVGERAGVGQGGPLGSGQGGTKQMLWKALEGSELL